MIELDIREVILIITGVTNLSLAIFSLIRYAQLYSYPGKMLQLKYTLMFMSLYFIALESVWIARGIYHVLSWTPIFWNIMDCLWLLLLLQLSEVLFKLLRPHGERKVDYILRCTLSKLMTKEKPNANE